MKRVLTFGTFDLFHPGHAFYLQQAKSFGDHLSVVVARDSTVREVKGLAPAQPESERLAAVQKLPYVDDAVLGKPGDKMQVVRDLRPDIICLGYDQNAFTQELAATFPHIKIVRISSHHPEKYKSSKMRFDR